MTNLVRQVGSRWLACHWRSLGAAALTIALCLGLAFFAIAGARRTQSAYPRFLDHVRSSTVSVSTPGPYTDETNSMIAAIPQVRDSRTYVDFSIFSLVDGEPDFSQVFEVTGTFDGRFFDQDRFVATEGRAADRDRLDEVAINEFGAERLGYEVGERLDLGAYGIDQIVDPMFFSDPPRPADRLTVTVVGIGVFPDEILQDDSDRTSRFLITPALSRRLQPFGTYGLQGLILDRGDADVPGFLDHLAEIVPIGDVEFRLTSVDSEHAARATNPLSLVLGVFGAIAAAVGILLSGQSLRRSIRSTRDELRLFVVLGASTRDVSALAMLLSLLSVAVGVLLAAMLAVAASPLMPIGPLRRVEADPGIDADFAVLGLGGGMAIVVLVGVSAWVVWRELPSSDVRFVQHAATSGPNRARTAVDHLPPPVAIGLRHAVGGGGGSSIAARSAIISAVAAATAVIAAVTFAASLTRLVRVPQMYGWNFDAAIVSGNGYDNLDEHRLGQILNDDPVVGSWSGVHFGATSVGDVVVPLLGMRADSTVRPTLIEGRFIEGEQDVVLGRATADALGADLGDTVVLDTGGTLQVVGVAVLPSIGKTHTLHTSLGRGAIVVPSLVPGSNLDILGNPQPTALGPNAVFVRFARDVPTGDTLAHLAQTMSPLRRFAGLDVVPAQRPAEIVVSEDVRAAPVVLAGALALAATISLLIALGTSARTHRRELAVLTALGFTRRQRAATMIWHAESVVVVGLLIGAPIGAVVGRELWMGFARRIDVFAPAVAPWTTGVVIAVGALVLAIAVAWGPSQAAQKLDVSAALRDQ